MKSLQGGLGCEQYLLKKNFLGCLVSHTVAKFKLLFKNEKNVRNKNCQMTVGERTPRLDGFFFSDFEVYFEKWKNWPK